MKTLSSGVYSLLGSIYVRSDMYFKVEFVERIFTVYETGHIHESGQKCASVKRCIALKLPINSSGIDFHSLGNATANILSP